MSSPILKKINKTNTFILSTLILVTACSKTPSKSDITASLEREAAENCQVLDFQNVEKINGIEISPTEYRVSAKYDVVIKPFPELTEPWTELNRRAKASNQLQKEFNSANQAVSEKYEPQIDALEKQSEELKNEILAASGDYSLDSRYIEMQAKISDAKNMKTLAQDEVTARYNQAYREAKIGSNLSQDQYIFKDKALNMLLKQCKHKSFSWDILEKALGTGAVEALANGATKQMTAELTFIKTENGWRLDL